MARSAHGSPAGDVLVLGYHAVSGTWPAPLSVTPEELRSQLSLLVRRGYRGMTFTEAARARPKREERLLAVTFDDAYRSVERLALPILSDLGLVGTVFAPTSYIGSSDPMSWPGIDHWTETPYRDELLPLSWKGLERLAASGWEIGSHSHSHRRLTTLLDHELRSELSTSLEICRERLGSCSSIAYPYGDADRRVISATREAGYEAGGTLPARLDGRDPLDWPRVGIYNRDDQRRFRLKVSPVVRRARASRAWAITSLPARLRRALD
jgi:peptidoglycan/xylan/chitin deacetylase (PgdA/CDA1 family)